MPISRRLVGLILIYITLDLSAASIPGAFVFDADDSVETLQRSRAETPVRVTAFTPGGPQGDVVLGVEQVVPELPVRRPPVGQLIRLLPGRALRTADPPPLSEDSD